ncbi:cell division regulator GpsB [Streptococcus moroccensis]|uniref:Cell cycle protein GpsB n=1 Tax=Streptococcus moroccensis TaxID=1451356 RepID=A0ABT9YTT0_9STRE|nr:cell division regulator GpsB [Streptococcus moroccensis]MDQ0223404.1 DivIVA domain-containing protein [Streptococcus moroccensis]
MAGIKFTTKDIFEQEFKISMRGYNKEEVDEFLDDIMKDYDVYEAKIKELKAEVSRLRNQGSKTASSMLNPEPIPERPEFARASTATNFDILKRINRLEKEVFGKQISED